MACDTRLKPAQTAQERAKEVQEAIVRLQVALASGRARAVVDRVTGALAFAGWEGASRDGVSDECVFRLAQKSGNTALLTAIAVAEQIAGRPVNKQAVYAGHHSHDGGKTWHHGH